MLCKTDLFVNLSMLSMACPFQMLPRGSGLGHPTALHSLEKEKAQDITKKHLKRSDAVETPVSSPYSSSFIGPHDNKKVIKAMILCDMCLRVILIVINEV